MPDLSRRDFVSSMLGGAAVAASHPWGFAEEKPKKNVLFIAVDDLRPELGCYGHPMIKSPNIDKLAAEGTLFTRTYCQQAICAPSRASLLSGCRPDTTKIYDLNNPLRTAMPDVLSLPQHFKKNGYTSIRLGKIYHHAYDDKPGWTEMPKPVGQMYCTKENLDLVRRKRAEAREKGLKGVKARRYSRATATECGDVPDNAYPDGAAADAAIEMIRKHKEKPFFLAVGFKKPHLPFNAPKKYWDMYKREDIKLPDRSQPKGALRFAFTNWGELRNYSDIQKQGDLNDKMTRKLIHGYYACVSYIDAQIGRVLDELKKQGLDKNTVVVLWGDHGWKLGEYGDWCKHTNFELDTHVPMIFRAPGFKGGQKCDALTEFVDIYPTLADLCGLGVPKHCEGLSVAPLLKDPKSPWKKAAFSQYPRGRVHGYSLRTERYRYTEWRENKTKKVVERELYDHQEGPFARKNLAKDPKHAELVSNLAKMMKQGWKGALPEKQ